MSYKITKVSGSNFWGEELEKFSQLSLMVAPEGGSGPSANIDSEIYFYYDTDYSKYVDDSLASTTMNKVNSAILKLREKFKASGALTDKELARIKKLTYDYWMMFHWNKYKERMNNEEFARAMKHKAQTKVNEVSFQNTKGVGIVGEEAIVEILTSALGSGIEAILLSYPGMANAISFIELTDGLFRLNRFIRETLAKLKDSEVPALKAIGDVANKSEAIHSELIEKVGMEKIFPPNAGLGDALGYLVQIILASISFATAGNPAGAAFNSALRAGASSIRANLIGSIKDVYDLLKMIITSGNIKSDALKIFSKLWGIAGSSVTSVLNSAAATS